MSGNLKNILSWIFKLAISLGVIGYLSHKLIEDGYQLRDITGIDLLPALLSFLLIPLNLGLGAQKWKIMVRNFYPKLSFEQAFGAILAGMTTGIFTPNRIGEYGGRVFMLPPGKRLEAVIVTFIDRVCQMMITLWMGSAALLGFFWFKYDMEESLKIALTLLVLIIDISLIGFAFSRHKIVKILEKYRHFKYIRIGQITLEKLQPKVLGRALFLAALRYIVFTFQFVLLLYAFGYDKGVLLAVWMIVLIFLFKSFAPTFALSELGVRETIAIFIMGQFQVADPAISFNATFLLYVFNVVLPSVIGMVFLPRMRFFDKKAKL